MVDIDNEAGRTAVLAVLRKFDLGPEQAAMVIEALKPVPPADLSSAMHPLALAYTAFFHGLLHGGLTREEALALTQTYLNHNAGQST